MANIMDILNEYMTNFLEKNVENKVKVKQTLIDWKSKENQSSLRKVYTDASKGSDSKKGKKALSGYNVFMKEQYKKMKAADDQLENGYIMSMVSKKWKEMSEKKQQIYKDKASSTNATMPAKKGSRKKPGQPKGASNAYIHFGLAMRPTIKSKHSDWDFKKINNEVSIQWKGMSDKKKEKYIKLAEADKKRYEKEMEKWKAEQTSDSEESGAESGEGSGDESGDESGEGSDEE